MFSKTLSKWNSYYIRNQDYVDRVSRDLRFIGRIALKTYILIKFIKWLDYQGPSFSLTTPFWVKNFTQKS